MILIIIFLVSYYITTGTCKDIHHFLVLLVCGLSNVLTGIVLFEGKQMEEFRKIDGLMILIQPLMGLKGNLEMTMASRMSTLMNIREDMPSASVVTQEIFDDMILVQSQATVISLITACFASLGVFFDKGESFNWITALGLCAISLLTANTACFILGQTIATPLNK